MKKFTVTKLGEYDYQTSDYRGFENKMVLLGGDDMQVSDGYHTMDELYEHRIELFIQLCKYHAAIAGVTDTPNVVWRSKFHSDGSAFEGWFILGIGKEEGLQITYHLPIDRWDDTASFAEDLDRAPEWDNHSSADVLRRLKGL